MTEFHTQKDHFLNEEQKKLKGEMTMFLLRHFHEFLINIHEKFDNQSMTDLIMSVLIMFNRYLLFNIINNSSATQMHAKESFARHFTKEIYNQIMERLGEQAKEKGH